MADAKLTALSENTAPLGTDILAIVGDPGGSPVNQKVQISKAIDHAVCNGRLTVETGVPISTTDQTAKTSVYFTPYRGNRIGLHDGSGAWTVLPFTELSLSLSGYTANKNYDIWVYNNSGTATLDSTIWTNDTTRATALALQDGIYVKTGATDRRYVGTIRITATTGQCEDSNANRYVWNHYNQVPRILRKSDTTDTWSYTTATWRSANNSTANRVSYVVGDVGIFINLRADGGALTVGSTASSATVGIAIDATDTNHATIVITAAGNGHLNCTYSIHNHYSEVGYHYAQWTEYANVSGSGASCTFLGDGANSLTWNAGISGWITG